MFRRTKKKKDNVNYVKNIIYAVKTLWMCCKKRVIHIAIQQFLKYFEELFYQVFFLWFVVGSIVNGSKFEMILQLIMICGVIFSIIALYNSYVRTSVIPKTNIKIYAKIYEELLIKARNVELGCYEQSSFYSKYTMAIDGAVERIIQTTTSFFDIVFGGLASFVAFTAIVLIDPYAGVFVVFPMIGNFVFGKLMNKIYYGRYVDNIRNQRVTNYVNRIMCLVDYAKEIRLSNIHNLLIKKYRDSIKSTINTMNKYGNDATSYMWLKNVFSFPIVFEGIMLYAAYRTMVVGSMNLASMAIIFGTMSTTSWILIGLFNTIAESMKNALSVEYLKEFLNYRETIPENQDGLIPSPNIRSIEFRNVSFSYEKDKPLIQNLSFIIYEDTCVAFVGRNGAGKSTLIKLLLRLYDPISGEILVNGINIKKYNLMAYRELFGVAFQDYKIFATSLKENIMMGRKVEDEDDVVKESLESVGLLHKINTFEKGINTNLTKEFDSAGEVLSGGENQKVIVARTIAKRAKINIYDEPSSALDPIAEYELYKSIMSGSRNSIILFVTHRLSSVKYADIVYLLDNGKIIEQGTHNSLIKRKGVYADMYTKQAKNYLAITRKE
jgi:ATP-binding cassette subfamily B protein